MWRRLFPLKISDFSQYVTLSEYGSIYNKKRITYCNNLNKDIGFIEYSVNTGNIHLFYITNEKYRNSGLGSQILNFVLDDIKKSGTNKAWLIANRYPHPFWEKNNFIQTINPHIPFPIYTKQL